jgi:glycosyltransferase involved in cell wall biosynthesis
MKVFFIGQKGIPAVGGGVENHVENLAISLVDMGHDVYAYNRFNYNKSKRKEYKGINIISLPSIASKSLDAISHTFLACLDFIFKRKADVVHFHSIGPSSLIWMIKLFRPKTKVVFTFHSQCYFNSKWGKLGKFYLMLGERIGCKMSDEVIVISKSLKKYVEEKYNIEAIYAPNGVRPIKNLEVKKIKELWNLEKDSYILSVSRIVKNKGLEHLIEAYKKINTDKKLVIAGDGNYLKEIKNLASDNKNIIFTGNQSGDVLAELFSNSYMFVQPSEAEGLSISLLEAMSAKRPILISDIDANKEAVSDKTPTFKTKDIDDLKNKIEEFLNKNNEEILDKSVKNSYNKVLTEYNWDQITKSIVDVYKK